MENKVRTKFEFTDEFGQTTSVMKTFEDCAIEDGSFDFLVDEFKSFMKTMFSQDLVDTIVIS